MKGLWVEIAAKDSFRQPYTQSSVEKAKRKLYILSVRSEYLSCLVTVAFYSTCLVRILLNHPDPLIHVSLPKENTLPRIFVCLRRREWVRAEWESFENWQTNTECAAMCNLRLVYAAWTFLQHFIIFFTFILYALFIMSHENDNEKKEGVNMPAIIIMLR